MITRNLFLSALLVGTAGCATAGGARASSGEHEAPAPQASAGATGDAEAMGGGSSADDHQPEIVHTGNRLALSWADAQDRYAKKGNKCSGDDAPDRTIGAPSQKNEMQQGHDHVVTFGFRYKEGTLIIRCRNDHVESTRVLSH
jgi:hypothetical protein